MRASGRAVRLRAMMPAAKSSSPLPLMATTWRFSWTARWVIRSAAVLVPTPGWPSRSMLRSSWLGGQTTRPPMPQRSMSPPKLTARAGEAGPDLPGWRAARPGGGAGLRPAAALPLGLLGLRGQLVTGRDGGGHDPGRHRDPGQPTPRTRTALRASSRAPTVRLPGQNIARATTASRSRPAATVGPIWSRARAPVTPPAEAKRPGDTQPNRTTQAPATQPRSAGGRAGAGPGRRPGTRKGLRGWPVGPDQLTPGGRVTRPPPQGPLRPDGDRCRRRPKGAVAVGKPSMSGNSPLIPGNHGK